MNQRWILVALYAFFIAGAMWSSLRALQPLMMMATPVVILVIVIGAFALTFQINLKSVGAGAAVMALVFLCEASGVNLGFPFGDYAFTNLLGPKLLDVPLVIPFIWIGILVPSWIASGKFLKYKHIVVASILVTAFDAVMEFAADALDLWHWKGGTYGAELHKLVCHFIRLALPPSEVHGGEGGQLSRSSSPHLPVALLPPYGHRDAVCFSAPVGQYPPRSSPRTPVRRNIQTPALGIGFMDFLSAMRYSYCFSLGQIFATAVLRFSFGFRQRKTGRLFS